MSNYPVNVTGNEFAISGPSREWEDRAPRPCESCGERPDTVTFQSHPVEGEWWICSFCYDVNLVELDMDRGPDPDDLRDRDQADRDPGYERDDYW